MTYESDDTNKDVTDKNYYMYGWKGRYDKEKKKKKNINLNYSLKILKLFKAKNFILKSHKIII